MQHNKLIKSPDSVKLVGGPGVGKTTLRDKFLYPDYVYTYDPGESSHHPSVCIMLEDVETEIIFLDGDTTDLDTQATLVIFSVTDPASLALAESKLQLDLVDRAGNDNPVILVGNKVDLVRTRLVPIHGNSQQKNVKRLTQRLCRGSGSRHLQRLQVRGGQRQPRPQRGHSLGRRGQADQTQNDRAGRADKLLQVRSEVNFGGAMEFLKFYFQITT